MAWYEEAVFYHIYPLGMTGAPEYNDYGQPADRNCRGLPIGSFLPAPMVGVIDQFEGGDLLPLGVEDGISCRHGIDIPCLVVISPCVWAAIPSHEFIALPMEMIIING